MKAKKLVTLALPIMLLGGCVTIETGGKKEEPKKEVSQSENKKEDSLSIAKGEETGSSSSSNKSSSSNSSSSSTGKVNSAEVEKYKADIVAKASEIENVMKVIEKVSNSDVKSYSAKKSEIQLSLGGAKAHVNTLRHLKAPKGFENDQETIKKSMDLYDESFSLLFKALDEGSESKVNQAVSKAQDGAKYWTEATESIARKTQ